MQIFNLANYILQIPLDSPIGWHLLPFYEKRIATLQYIIILAYVHWAYSSLNLIYNHCVFILYNNLVYSRQSVRKIEQNTAKHFYRFFFLFNFFISKPHHDIIFIHLYYHTSRKVKRKSIRWSTYLAIC